jgi:hypothetical protein
MAQLGNALASRDVPAVDRLLVPMPLIRNFTSDSAQPAERLIAATMDARVLGVHAYLGVPSTVATDLATDVKEAGEAIPQQAMVAGLVPADEAAARRANETAAAWVAQVLQPGPDDLVGVIVVWPGKRSDLLSPSARHPIFVLVKGRANPDGGCTVQRIHFGDPLDSFR